MKLREIVAMLKDTGAWHVQADFNFGGRLIHQSGIWCFDNTGGISFRDAKYEIVYDAGFLAWLVTMYYVSRLNRALKLRKPPKLKQDFADYRPLQWRD